MIQIRHRFLSHPISSDTKILLVGTFNPDVADNDADFFYGRIHNHMWRLLPSAYNEKDLKSSSVSEKLMFMKKHRIDFIDLISEIEVEKGQESNYSDNYIDGHVLKWNDCLSIFKNLNGLEKLGFTRRTFSGIPNIRSKLNEIEKYCRSKGILFRTLLTPARIYSKEKQEAWSEFLLCKK